MQLYLRYVQSMQSVLNAHCVHGRVLGVMRLNKPDSSFLHRACDLVRMLYQNINNDHATDVMKAAQGT